MTAKKAIQYSYVKLANKKYVQKMAIKNNRPASEFIDELISAHRLKRPVKFEARELKIEQRAKRAKDIKQSKLKALRT